MNKEELIKKSKLLRNIGIGCIAIAAIALFGGMDGKKEDIKNLTIGSIAFCVVALILFVISWKKKKESDEIISVTNDNMQTNMTTDNMENSNVSQHTITISSSPVQNKEKPIWVIWLIVAIVIIVLGATFAGNGHKNTGSGSGVSNKVLEAAIRKAKSMVAHEDIGVPECKAECIWSGEEDSIIKVSWKAKGDFCGTYFYHVVLSTAFVFDGHYYYSHFEYDRDMTEEEIELAIAQWELH